MLYVIFLMLSLNWLFISSVIELIAELVVCSSDTMIAEKDVSMKADSSNKNKNTILADGLTGTCEAPTVDVKMWDVCTDCIKLLFVWEESQVTLYTAASMV